MPITTKLSSFGTTAAGIPTHWLRARDEAECPPFECLHRAFHDQLPDGLRTYVFEHLTYCEPCRDDALVTADYDAREFDPPEASESDQFLPMITSHAIDRPAQPGQVWRVVRQTPFGNCVGPRPVVVIDVAPTRGRPSSVPCLVVPLSPYREAARPGRDVVLDLPGSWGSQAIADTWASGCAERGSLISLLDTISSADLGLLTKRVANEWCGRPPAAKKRPRAYESHTCRLFEGVVGSTAWGSGLACGLYQGPEGAEVRSIGSARPQVHPLLSAANTEDDTLSLRLAGPGQMTKLEARDVASGRIVGVERGISRALAEVVFTPPPSDAPLLVRLDVESAGHWAVWAAVDGGNCPPNQVAALWHRNEGGGEE